MSRTQSVVGLVCWSFLVLASIGGCIMLISALANSKDGIAGILLDKGMRLALSSPILLIASAVGLVVESRKLLRKK